ncbi:hypothetical protein Avi_0482 [Allorhizobium ampelinum S4]|uniref:Uncharacterized protein n=1 Tax=Allorhizobium ampelinum (strain ATCC BAA-846 / DSM 112012 / S4) TaxID=311402 RepID=B9JQS5_ALLAM|nr:hypothetical protein Avi_0482 [Allorhizobium ampelinum S4]
MSEQCLCPDVLLTTLAEAGIVQMPPKGGIFDFFHRFFGG